MKTKTINVYQYKELSESAKEKARQWYCEGFDGQFEWDCTKDDAKTIGLKLDGMERDYMRGSFLTSARECAESILKEHGESCKTYKTAESFLKERDKTVDDAERDENGELVSEYDLDQKLDEIEEEFLKSILEDYRIMYEKDIEYQQSEEAIAESMEANEYEFDENGKRI